MAGDLEIQTTDAAAGGKRKLSDFGDLWPAERALLTACNAGHRAKINPTRPEKPAADNRIRSALIRFLALGGDSESVVHENGIEVQGAWFDDELDLSGCNVTTRLGIFSSSLFRGLRLTDSKLQGLHLDGCQVGGIQGQRLSCNGGIFLTDGFRARAETNLVTGKITGDVSCDGGHFESVDGVALNLDGIDIGGRLFMRRGFRAAGGVSLVDAKIANVTVLRAATFNNPGLIALNCDRASLGGGLLLGRGCQINGCATLIGVRVTGDFACEGVSLNNAGAIALQADGAEITGRLFLRNDLGQSGRCDLLQQRFGGRWIVRVVSSRTRIELH
jgi:hypothetical protein